MQLLDLTLPSFAENLALDECLLEEIDSDDSVDDVLRLWEATTPAVIVGRSSRIAEEVNLDFCRGAQIPVLRRCSGGTSVVLGPGCLGYAVLVRFDRHRGHRLQMIDELHRFVLGTIGEGLRRSGWPVDLVGISDLAIDGRKVSGNSLRCKRHAALYHGTLLYDFPLDLIQSCLGTAPRQPEYRAGRRHRDFVTNLTATRPELKDALRSAWQVAANRTEWPRAHMQQLVVDRYGKDEWHQRL